MKVYRGKRNAGGTFVSVHDESGLHYQLDWRLDIANHSPTGLEWGYGGSGPAQLAIAILADHFNVPKPAPRRWDMLFNPTPEMALVRRVYGLHQPFKFLAIAVLDRSQDVTWEMTSDDVDRHVAVIEAEQASSIARPTIGGDLHERGLD